MQKRWYHHFDISRSASALLLRHGVANDGRFCVVCQLVMENYIFSDTDNITLLLVSVAKSGIDWFLPKKNLSPILYMRFLMRDEAYFT